MAVLRFRMSGQDFEFDGSRDLSALEVCALDEIGLRLDDFALAMTRLDDGLNVRVLCAVAYIARLRVNPQTRWRDFAASIAPATFEQLPAADEPEPVAETPEAPEPNRATRRAAAKRRPKGQGAEQPAEPVTVGDALAEPTPASG